MWRPLPQPRHPSHALLIPLGAAGALAVQGCTVECPAGSSLRDDGLCHLDDQGSDDTSDPDGGPGGGTGAGTGGDTGGDTGGGTGAGTGGDTGSQTWVSLPEHCDAPPEPGPDPVFRQANFYLQGDVFAELIDVEVDVSRGEMWGAGQGGLVGIDISDPFNLRFLSSVAPHDWFQRAYQMHLGPYPALYGTHRDQGLIAYDRTDPSRPEEARWVRTTNLSGMDHADGYLYVAGHGGDLQTYDISAPLQPSLVDATGGLGNGWTPLVSGDFLYVADNTLGIVVFDRSTPAAPVYVTQVDTAGGAQDITLSADRSTLYAAVGGAGVEVFSLDDPAAPAPVGLIDVSYSAISISADQDTLWAATQQDVVAIDIQVPRAPVLLNTDETQQWAMAVDADRGRAYVGDWGYASVYGADLTVSAPDADPSTTEVHLDADGGIATLRIQNLGNAPLSLLGATTDVAGLGVGFTSESVGAAGAVEMQVTWEGDASGLDAEICIATDDPDQAQQRISVSSGGGAGEYLGLAAPDFALQGLDGQTHRLSEQLGHPVVLVYFATW